MTEDFPLGAFVTHDDEPDTTSFYGCVVAPTAEETADLKTYYSDGGVGPGFGDVLVEWNDSNAMPGESGDRSWEQPDTLKVLRLPR